MKDTNPFAALKQQGLVIRPDILSAEFPDRTMVEIWQSAPRLSKAGVRYAPGAEPVIELARCREIAGWAPWSAQPGMPYAHAAGDCLEQ